MHIPAAVKSLDLYLAECGQVEASKIDSVTYGCITDIAAMHRILSALLIHRPALCMYYASTSEIRKTRDSRVWSTGHINFDDFINNPRKFRFGNALDNLDKFRMPTGEKTKQWLAKADKCVSYLRNHDPCCLRYLQY